MATRILVIEVKVADHGGVDESRILGCRSFPKPQDVAHISLRNSASCQTASDPGRLALIGCDSAGKAVHHSLLCGADNFIGYLRKSEAGCIVRDDAGHVVHGLFSFMISQNLPRPHRKPM